MKNEINRVPIYSPLQQENFFYGQLILNKENKTELKFIDQFIYSPITEAITQEQKKKAQTEMAKKNLDPFYRLRVYLLNKWINPKTKEKFIQKNIEFERFNKILNIMKKARPKYENPARQYFKKATGIKQKRIHTFNSNYGNGIQTREVKGVKIPYLLLDTNPEIGQVLNGLNFSINDKELYEKIYAFMINHELGHIYEYLKELVEKDSAKLINTFKEKNRDNVIDSEGKANAYAIDNMSRFDRREILKNSDEINYGMHKEYLVGLKKHSKTYKKTKDSIEKEKYFNY